MTHNDRDVRNFMVGTDDGCQRMSHVSSDTDAQPLKQMGGSGSHDWVRIISWRVAMTNERRQVKPYCIAFDFEFSDRPAHNLLVCLCCHKSEILSYAHNRFILRQLDGCTLPWEKVAYRLHKIHQ